MLSMVFKIDLLLFAIIATLLPDIDTSKSYINRTKNRYVTFILLTVLNMFLIKYVSLFKLAMFEVWLIMSVFSKHRHYSHSLLGLLMFSIVFYRTSYFLPAVIGYATHIFCDLLTIHGVVLLYPFDKRFRISKMTTNKMGERVLCYVVFAINVYLILSLLF